MPAFLFSSLFAFVGGHMVNYTVILYLQERVGSDLLSGIGFGLAFGSSIVFGWFAGVACDRAAPGRIIHAAHGLFLVCLAGLLWAELGASDAARVPVVLVSALFGGLAWSFFGPARLATLGQIVPDERLRNASILFNLQVLIGFGLAPLVIGLIRSRAGWPEVIFTAMACFVVSSLLLATTRTRANESACQGTFRAIASGFAAVRANALLRQLLFAAMIGFAMTGPLQILLPKLAREVLGLTEAQRGAYLGLMALALILGGVLALPLSRRLHHGRTIFLGLGIGGLLFAGLSRFADPVASALLLLAVGSIGGLVISLVVAGIQAQAPDAVRGRIMSMYSMISQVIPALSGIAAGALVKAVGTVPALLLAGMALVALAGAGAMLMPTLRRQAR